MFKITAFFLLSVAFATTSNTAELQLTNWPPADSWPLPRANRTQFLEILAQISNFDRDAFQSLLVVFDVGIVVLESNTSNSNVTHICESLQESFQLNNTLAFQQFSSNFSIAKAVCTKNPVEVPGYAIDPPDDPTIVFNVLGGVAVCLIVTQIAFGLFHFRSFDFVTLKDEE